MSEWGGEEASLLGAITSCVSAAGGNNLVELASMTSGTAVQETAQLCYQLQQ